MLMLSNVRLITIFAIIFVHTISWTTEAYNHSLNTASIGVAPLLIAVIWIFSTIPLMSGVYLYFSKINSLYEKTESRKKWLQKICGLGLVLFSLDILKNILFYGFSSFFYTEILNMIGVSYILIAITGYISIYLTLIVGVFIFALSNTDYKSNFHVEIANAYLKDHTGSLYLHYTMYFMTFLLFLLIFNKIQNLQAQKVLKRNLLIGLLVISSIIIFKISQVDINNKNTHLSFVYYFKNLLWGSGRLNYSFWPIAPWTSQVLIGYSVVSIFNRYKIVLTDKYKYALGLLGVFILIAPTDYTYVNYQTLSIENERHYLWNNHFFNTGLPLVICGIGTVLLLASFIDKFSITLFSTEFTRLFNKSILWIYLFMTTVARKICHFTAQYTSFSIGLFINIVVIFVLCLLITYFINRKKIQINLKKL